MLFGNLYQNMFFKHDMTCCFFRKKSIGFLKNKLCKKTHVVMIERVKQKAVCFKFINSSLRKRVFPVPKATGEVSYQ